MNKIFLLTQNIISLTAGRMSFGRCKRLVPMALVVLVQTSNAYGVLDGIAQGQTFYGRVPKYQVGPREDLKNIPDTTRPFNILRRDNRIRVIDRTTTEVLRYDFSLDEKKPQHVPATVLPFLRRNPHIAGAISDNIKAIYIEGTGPTSTDPESLSTWLVIEISSEVPSVGNTDIRIAVQATVQQEACQVQRVDSALKILMRTEIVQTLNTNCIKVVVGRNVRGEFGKLPKALESFRKLLNGILNVGLQIASVGFSREFMLFPMT